MQAISRKIFMLLLPFSILCANGQEDLVFNKRFAESEDKWVVFQKDEDNVYLLGFIYIDAAAGLTLNYESHFTISGEGKFIRKAKIDSSMVSYKIRLENNNVTVAWLPSARFDELGLQETPVWLSNYKSYTDTARRLQRWGYYYNDWGMPEKALEYLEPGYKSDPDYKDMAVELAFAYNALKQFDKAIPVLLKAAERKPDDGYIYKELSYAYLSTDNLEAGAKAAENGIRFYKDDRIKAEIAYNVAYHCYVKKDKKNFSRWAGETRKWAKKDSGFLEGIINMDKKLAE